MGEVHFKKYQVFAYTAVPNGYKNASFKATLRWNNIVSKLVRLAFFTFEFPQLWHIFWITAFSSSGLFFVLVLQFTENWKRLFKLKRYEGSSMKRMEWNHHVKYDKMVKCSEFYLNYTYWKILHVVLLISKRCFVVQALPVNLKWNHWRLSWNRSHEINVGYTCIRYKN